MIWSSCGSIWRQKEKINNMSVISNCIRGFSASTYFKLRQKFHASSNKVLQAYYKFRVMRIEAKNNAYIGLFTNADRKDVFVDIPVLPHGINGLHISARVKIGKRATIHQNVTIGEGKERNVPIIGDDVFIGANACIVGGIKVGNRVKIGAGAVVVKDVPDDTTVVAQPCRYITITK